MEKIGKKLMVFIIGCLIIISLTTVFLLNFVDCSKGLCDGPGYGILVIEINLLLLVVFSIIYWIVAWRMKK